MSQLRMVSARSFANSHTRLWARIGPTNTKNALSIDSISQSDLYENGTCIGLEFNPDNRKTVPTFWYSKKVYSLHMPVPFRTIFSACKDFRAVASRHDDLNLTDDNLPRLQKFYEGGGIAPTQALCSLLCLPYALHRLRS